MILFSKLSRVLTVTFCWWWIEIANIGFVCLGAFVVCDTMQCSNTTPDECSYAFCSCTFVNCLHSASSECFIISSLLSSMELSDGSTILSHLPPFGLVLISITTDEAQACTQAANTWSEIAIGICFWTWRGDFLPFKWHFCLVRTNMHKSLHTSNVILWAKSRSANEFNGVPLHSCTYTRTQTYLQTHG